MTPTAAAGAHDDLWRAIGALRAGLATAQRRIADLEAQTPAALAAQLEADHAAADLAESGARDGER